MVTMNRPTFGPLPPADAEIVFEDERTSEDSMPSGRRVPRAARKWRIARVEEENPGWTHEFQSSGHLTVMTRSTQPTLAIEHLELVNKLFEGTIGADVPSLRLLESAKSLAGLVDAGRMALLDDAADQIEILIPKLESDPELDQFDANAVRHALRFLAQHRNLPDPDIGAVEKGRVDLSWTVGPDGVAFVEVDETGIMSFAMNVPENNSEERQRMSGTTRNVTLVACVLGQVLNAYEAE